MLKHEISERKTEEVMYSLKKMAVLSELMIYEYQQYLTDTRFSCPTINNFVKRVGTDTKEIKSRLRSLIAVKTDDHAEEYIGQLWRILDVLCRLDLDVLKEHAEYLEKVFEEIGEE